MADNVDYSTLAALDLPDILPATSSTATSTSGIFLVTSSAGLVATPTDLNVPSYATAANMGPTMTTNSLDEPRLKRSASSGDIVWLRQQGRKVKDLNFDEELGDDDIAGFEDAFSKLDLIGGSKVTRTLWTKQKAPMVSPITEENSMDDFLVNVEGSSEAPPNPSPRRASVDVVKNRSSSNMDKAKCSQSIMMRWLASTSLPQGAKLPPSAKGLQDKGCKDFNFAFKSRDMNAVTPSNW